MDILNCKSSIPDCGNNCCRPHYRLCTLEDWGEPTTLWWHKARLHKGFLEIEGSEIAAFRRRLFVFALFLDEPINVTEADCCMWPLGHPDGTLAGLDQRDQVTSLFLQTMILKNIYKKLFRAKVSAQCTKRYSWQAKVLKHKRSCTGKPPLDRKEAQCTRQGTYRETVQQLSAWTRSSCSRSTMRRPIRFHLPSVQMSASSHLTGSGEAKPGQVCISYIPADTSNMSAININETC